MEKRSSIRTGTSWLLTGNIGRRVLEFLFGVALARILVPADFGILVTVQIFTGAAGFLAGGGMGQSLIQAKQVERRHFHVVFTLQLAICVLIYSVFFIISPRFAEWFDNPVYTDLLRVSALTFLIRPFMNVSSARLKRDMRFKGLSIISVLSLLVTGVTSIVLALLGHGVWSLVLGGIAGSLFSAACVIYLSGITPGFAFDRAIARTLGKYGFQMSLNEIIHYIRLQAPNFLIGKTLGPTALGLFNKGDSLSQIPITMIGGSAYQAVFRALSSVQGNLDQSRYLYLKTVSLVSVYTMPFYVLLMWVAEPFIVTIYGEKWALAAIPLQILSVAGILRCVSNPSGAVMAAQKKLGTEIRIQLTTLLLVVLGCVPGILAESLTLIALGLLPAALFFSTALAFYALRTLDARFFDLFRALQPALILNLILAALLLALHLLLSATTIGASPPLFLTVFSGTGLAVYSLLFLFLPIHQLESESQRWKRLLRLSAA
ncbi:MAG TPA: lipopolysaccharide biosynthesis protein [Sedimenticola sp.]|nr:lipopolysaccharide biosynthesis protein [Sedimenticola sp.]